MTAQCESLRDDLKAYLDNELSWPHRLRMRRHLRGCASCREEVGAMQKITEEVRGSESEVGVLDAGLRDKILAGVEGVPSMPQGRKPREADLTLAPRKTSPLAWAGAVAAILLFASVSTSLMGRKVQTVFNVAQNALTTSEDVIPDVTFPPPAAPAGAPSPANSAGPMNFGRYDNRNNQLKRVARQESVVTKREREVDALASSSAFRRNLESDLAPQRRVHKGASITVQVSDLEDKTSTVEQMTKNIGGYVANNDLETGGDGLRRSILTLKVPVGQFESVLDKIAKLGLVKSKQVSGEDITARVSDAEQAKTVLANQLGQQVERLKRAKAKDKAQERHEARLIQIQLAQARARYNMLNKLATLSTIAVQLQEKSTPAVQGGGFTDELGKTKQAATSAFMDALRVPLIVLMWILAYSPLWIPLLLIYRFASRTYLRRTP